MILVADDFGISVSVNTGILELIEKKRISATSCMVTENIPNDQTQQLIELSKKIDIGLHLVLTRSRPISKPKESSGLINSTGNFHTFKDLSRLAYLRKLESRAVDEEVQLQIEKFEELFGRAPEYIDGHQHVHQLPIIRNSVLRWAKATKEVRYIRTANLPLGWIQKNAIQLSFAFAIENLILTLPGRGLSHLLNKNGVAHNRFLLGHYNHSSRHTFSAIFKAYMSLNPQQHDIFYCHPGYVDDHLRRTDTVVETRKENLDFLLSSEFQDFCLSNQVHINRQAF